MAYNGYFPTGYQGYYNPYQQNGFQQPAQNINPMQTMQQTQMGQNLPGAQMSSANAAQMMTPPTIHAEIVQVGSKEEANNFPVGVGSSQMMILKDDSAIFVKTAFANGQSNLDVYLKAPKEQEQPVVHYVTHEELEQRLADLMASQPKEMPAPKKQAKKGDSE